MCVFLSRFFPSSTAPKCNEVASSASRAHRRNPVQLLYEDGCLQKPCWHRQRVSCLRVLFAPRGASFTRTPSSLYAGICLCKHGCCGCQGIKKHMRRNKDPARNPRCNSLYGKDILLSSASICLLGNNSSVLGNTIKYTSWYNPAANRYSL